MSVTYGAGGGTGTFTAGIASEIQKEYDLDIVEICENDDDEEKTYICTERLIREFGDELDVIYVTSHDSVAVCRCLEDLGKQDRIKVIGHDIFDEMIEYMERRMLIASVFLNAEESGRRALSLLVEKILGNGFSEKEIKIKPELVLKGNLECYKCDKRPGN